MRNNKGFTLVELLVVLVIVAILAAVATPLYLANAQRAKVSEAVATMGLIRQAERDFRVNNNTYFDIATDDVQDPLPALADITLTSGAVTAGKGLAVDAGIPQYFSNAAYTVDAKGTTGTLTPATNNNVFTNPSAQDFIITVDGTASIQCTSGVTTDCAVKGTDVGASPAPSAQAFKIQMDNTGRTAVTYDGGTTWASY